MNILTILKCLPNYCSRPSCRTFHLSFNNTGKSYTRESKPVPGSDSFSNPDGWAKRLFKLRDHGENLPTKSTDCYLFMVCRLKPLKGIMHYHRAILEKYKLGQHVKNHTWVIVKNVPSVVDELNVIKHLIKVQPITFVNGIPQNANDLATCRLLRNGKFSISQSAVHNCNSTVNNPITDNLKSEIDEKTESNNSFIDHCGNTSNNYLTRAYLRQYYNKQWKRHELFKDHFTSHYKYKLNQDNNEYRYSRLRRLDDAMIQSVKSLRNADGTSKQPNCNRFEADWNTFPWSTY